MTDKINEPEVARDEDGVPKGAKDHLKVLLSAIEQRGLQTQVGQRIVRQAEEFLAK